MRRRRIMDNEKLATELLHEIKMSAKRWFIAFCIMVVLEFATIGGFVWYISLPVDETNTTIENDEGNTNYVGGSMSGVINNGEGQNNSKDNTQSNEE